MSDIPTSALLELTPEAVDRAQRGECDNPIFDVITAHQILMRSCTSSPVADETDAFVNDLISVAPFELDIETIIAAWAIGLPEPERSGMPHAFSIPLFSTYSLYDTNHPEATSRITHDYLRTNILDRAILPNEGYAVKALARVRNIAREHERLSVFVNGATDMNEITRLARSSEPEDIKTLDELIGRAEARRTPLLGAVLENVTNAIQGLSLKLDFLVKH